MRESLSSSGDIFYKKSQYLFPASYKQAVTQPRESFVLPDQRK
jgi:hypothetical protein